jgi:hypothetical protein
MEEEAWIYRGGTEYAEILYFKLSPPRPPRLSGELSEAFSIGGISQ